MNFYRALCCIVSLSFFWCFCLEKQLYLTIEDNVLIKTPVPEKGVVCSNYERALRLTHRLESPQIQKTPWGPFVACGDYKGSRVFVACAPIGSGSGLMFTELYSAGAKYILRCGSEDAKAPAASEAFLVKIVDEADDLLEFNIQSGMDPKDCQEPIQASPQMIHALVSLAKKKQIAFEMRICHHLENYHSLRLPEKYAKDRCNRINKILNKLYENPKPCSFDMETAVLFAVANDFNKHAATVLQTVNKEDPKMGPYEKENYKQARDVEENIFFDFVLDALCQL